MDFEIISGILVGGEADGLRVHAYEDGDESGQPYYRVPSATDRDALSRYRQTDRREHGAVVFEFDGVEVFHR